MIILINVFLGLFYPWLMNMLSMDLFYFLNYTSLGKTSLSLETQILGYLVLNTVIPGFKVAKVYVIIMIVSR